MDKQVSQVARRLRKQGLEVRHTGTGHLAVMDGPKKVYVLPSTPSDRRWYRNAISELKNLGLWDREKIDKDAGGMTPPPAIAERKEAPVSTGEGHHSTSVQLDEDLQYSALETAQRVENHFNLTVYKGRVTAQGVVPIMAQIMEAYEAETGSEIPSFDYTDRDTSNRVDIARLCANRWTDVAAKNMRDYISPITALSVLYAGEAWDWFVARGGTFPDGRKLVKQGYKWVAIPMQVEEGDVSPLLNVPDDVIDELLSEDLGPSFLDAEPFTADLSVDVAETTTPVSPDSGVSMERVLLAIEVASRVANHGDPDRGVELALQVLTVQ